MVYVDPFKLLSRELSPMDVVNAVNDSNIILPAGDVKIGPFDYYVYSNSLVDTMQQLDEVPLKAVKDSWVRVSDVGKAVDGAAIQYNINAVAGQKSTYIPIMKAGSDTNTIEVVNSVRKLMQHLRRAAAAQGEYPFRSIGFCQEAINTVMHNRPGSDRDHDPAVSGECEGHELPVLLSIAAALGTVVVLKLMGATINTMILAGIALAFSRVIDNSVISLENIYRHLGMDPLPKIAAEIGGSEVVLAVLAATLVDVVDFFPVSGAYAGVSSFVHGAGDGVSISLLMSFVVAMTVIPLFCSKFLTGVPHSRIAENEDETAGRVAQKPIKRRKASHVGPFCAVQPSVRSRAGSV